MQAEANLILRQISVSSLNQQINIKHTHTHTPSHLQPIGPPHDLNKTHGNVKQRSLLRLPPHDVDVSVAFIGLFTKGSSSSLDRVISAWRDNVTHVTGRNAVTV